MWTLPRIKIRRDFLPLQTIDFVHLCRKLVNESDEWFRACVFHLLPKSPHYSTDMFRPWISINSLRLDCRKSFNAPKVVPLWSEKTMDHYLQSGKALAYEQGSDIHSWNEVVESLGQRSYRSFLSRFADSQARIACKKKRYDL